MNDKFKILLVFIINNFLFHQRFFYSIIVVNVSCIVLLSMIRIVYACMSNVI
jgi:hypothetical protein